MLGYLSGLVLLIFLGGCAHHPKLNHKSLELDQTSESKLSLTRREFKEDLAVVAYALERAYGGLPLHPKEKLESALAQLKALTFTADPTLLCERLGEILKVLPDQHLTVQYGRNKCARPVNPPMSFGTNLNSTNKAWRGFIEKDKRYVIAISHFPAGHWPGFLEFVREARDKAKAIVIDLRGNRGGDDSISYQMVRILADQEVRTPYGGGAKRLTPETLMVFRNCLSVMKEHATDPDEIRSLDAYLAENARQLAKSIAGEYPEYVPHTFAQTPWKYDPRRGFKGRIYILQDKKCVSSCESTIDLFEYFPRVTRVGGNTAGMVHSGNLGLLMLPNSNIQFNVPTKYNTYLDNRFIENIGIKPDVSLSSGQDAYEYVMKKIL